MKTKKLIWMPILALATIACQDCILFDKDICPADKAGTFISVTLNTPTITRANPTGGETGDGTEIGQTNENTVSDITIFFYKSSDINQAITDNVLVSKSIYFGTSDIINNTTKTRRVEIPKGIYHLIIVANAGDLTYEFTTVKNVCNYLQKTAWTVSGTDYSKFVMSSSNDSSIELTGTSTEASPIEIDVNVERLAARVDFIPYNSSNAPINTYYVSNSGNTTGQVAINKIKLINRLTAGSYLLKRVATSMSATPSYLGNETLDQNSFQSNYVIDPWTIIKTKTNLTGSHFNLLNGGAGSDPASSLYTNYFNNSFTLGSEDVVKTANLTSTSNGEKFYILGYTLENTTDMTCQMNGYSTGVMFETKYTPTSVTAYNATTRLNEAKTLTNAVTFYTYDNNNVICNSLEAIEFASLKSSQPANDFFAQIFTTANTWQEVQNYANRIKDYDLLGFKAYLSDKLNGKVLTANLNETISWDNFVSATYGYLDGSINQNGIDTRLVLFGKNINCYINGLCYYPYWIRHSNNGTIDESIMEFGIVRNNVYKLKVISFSGLGKPMPYSPTDTPENPDEESFVSVFITVSPWRLIAHPDVVL
nr:Mfa1 family fimbria major subunit [uncultured Bacteroides sp.]